MYLFKDFLKIVYLSRTKKSRNSVSWHFKKKIDESIRTTKNCKSCLQAELFPGLFVRQHKWAHILKSSNLIIPFSQLAIKLSSYHLLQVEIVSNLHCHLGRTPNVLYVEDNWAAVRHWRCNSLWSSCKFISLWSIIARYCNWKLCNNYKM